MPLTSYQAALESVGRDDNGNLAGWTRSTNPIALLESLPLPADDRRGLLAKAQQVVAAHRRRPSTPAAFLARALLGWCFSSVDSAPDVEQLADMAELALALPADSDLYAAMAARCVALNTPSATGLPPSHHPSATTPVAGGVPGPSTWDLRFVHDALILARDEIILSAASELDVEDDAYDAALDALEQQSLLGRAVARDLGFPDMHF